MDTPDDSIFQEAIQLMLQSDGDIRGTVASLAGEIEDQATDGSSQPFILHLLTRCFQYSQ
jgi:hypothetical protein